MPLKSGKPRKFINKLMLVVFMAQYSDLYNPSLSRREFSSGVATLAIGLAKAAALVGLVRVVAACDSDNVENFKGKARGKDYDYYARSTLYTIDLQNSNGSPYATFEGNRSGTEHPDILGKVKFHDGKSEPVKIFTVYSDELYEYADGLTGIVYSESNTPKEAKDIFENLKKYYYEIQEDVANKREIGKKKS